MSNDWVQFTKRTDDPKLAWLQARLTDLGIENRRNGDSWHAPIMEVREDDKERAWKVLGPVDLVPDDDDRWPHWDLLPGEAYPWDELPEVEGWGDEQVHSG